MEKKKKIKLIVALIVVFNLVLAGIMVGISMNLKQTGTVMEVKTGTITVRFEEDRDPLSFKIDDDTKITDRDRQRSSADRIKPGDKVEIIYNAINKKTKSIKLIP